MVKSIVVCVDGSTSGEEALDQSVELSRQLGAALRVISVVPIVNIYYLTGPVPAVPDEQQVRYHWELVTRYVERARARGVKDVGFAVLDGSPVDAILDYLDREPADLLVVGARGLSRTQRLLLGSVSTALVQQAKCSVMVAKARTHPVSAAVAAQRQDRKVRVTGAPPA